MTQIRWIVLSVAWCLVFAGRAPAQTELRNARAEQYKRVHQAGLDLILAERFDDAVTAMETFLADNPGDAESFFIAALAYSAAGRASEAETSVLAAKGAGLPPSRWFAGDLPGQADLRAGDVLSAERELYRGRPVHGPILGRSTPASVAVWLRTAEETDVGVLVRRADQTAWRLAASSRTSSEADFTTVLAIGDLEPESTYEYAVIVGGQTTTSPDFRIRTPAAEQPGKLRIAFGGGSGYVPQHERMWNTIAGYSPDALLLLGDNVYIDYPTSRPMQDYCYHRRQSRPEFAALTAQTPVFAIWDDHDFGTNDCVEGPLVDVPAWKPRVWEVFQRNWPNPPYAGGDAPGCYYAWRLGDVEFFFLDGRYYRADESHGVDPPSMLGPAQKAWLIDAAVRSDAAFKVLVSPVPWTFEAKGDSRDTWNGFRAERDEIFGSLTAHGVTGVLLLSADRHRSDLWRIDRDGAYPLYEFCSSRLTNQHVHAVMPQAMHSYNAKQSFGLVEFDLSDERRSIDLRAISIDGEEAFRHTILLGALSDNNALQD